MSKRKQTASRASSNIHEEKKPWFETRLEADTPTARSAARPPYQLVDVLYGSLNDQQSWEGGEFWPFVGGMKPLCEPGDTTWEEWEDRFVICGSDTFALYQCTDNDLKGGRCQLLWELRVEGEEIYHLDWSYNIYTGHPIIAVGGKSGSICIYDMVTLRRIRVLIGHGGGIFSLKFHPYKPYILASASEDHTTRIWNIHGADVTENRIDQNYPQARADEGLCSVAILEGEGLGHIWSVIGLAWNPKHNAIATCGWDYGIKIWPLPILPDPLEEEHQAPIGPGHRPIKITFPVFSTRDVHSNVIDSIEWLSPNILVSRGSVDIAIWRWLGYRRYFQPGQEQTLLKNLSAVQHGDFHDSHSFEVLNRIIIPLSPGRPPEWYRRLSIHRPFDPNDPTEQSRKDKHQNTVTSCLVVYPINGKRPQVNLFNPALRTDDPIPEYTPGNPRLLDSSDDEFWKEHCRMNGLEYVPPSPIWPGSGDEVQDQEELEGDDYNDDNDDIAEIDEDDEIETRRPNGEDDYFEKSDIEMEGSQTRRYTSRRESSRRQTKEDGAGPSRRIARKTVKFPENSPEQPKLTNGSRSTRYPRNSAFSTTRMVKGIVPPNQTTEEEAQQGEESLIPVTPYCEPDDDLDQLYSDEDDNDNDNGWYGYGNSTGNLQSATATPMTDYTMGAEDHEEEAGRMASSRANESNGGMKGGDGDEDDDTDRSHLFTDGSSPPAFDRPTSPATAYLTASPAAARRVPNGPEDPITVDIDNDDDDDVQPVQRLRGGQFDPADLEDEDDPMDNDDPYEADEDNNREDSGVSSSEESAPVIRVTRRNPLGLPTPATSSKHTVSIETSAVASDSANGIGTKNIGIYPWVLTANEKKFQTFAKKDKLDEKNMHVCHVMTSPRGARWIVRVGMCASVFCWRRRDD